MIDSDKERSPVVGRRASRSAPLLAGSFSFTISFGVLAVFWYRDIRASYFPSGDEFSLFVNSARPFHPAISNWILQGFSRYFIPYPEWVAVQTNFLRPVVNAEYYLGSLVFGSHWSWYLLSNYGIQSALVAAVVYLALRHLKIPLWGSLGIGLLCFVSPAFDKGALFLTSFAFDLLAALFVFLGLSQLLSGRRTLAWIFFAIAIFTKETALFAPFAAAAAIYGTSTDRGPRRFLAPAWFLSPYVAWFVLRHIAFHGALGVYAVPHDSFPVYVAGVLKNFLKWPFPWEIPPNRRSGAMPSLLLYGSAILNVWFWAVCIGVFLRSALSKTSHSSRGPQDRRTLLDQAGFTSPAERVVLLFCACSIVLLIVLPNLAPRFGATVIPMIALNMAIVAHAGRKRFLRVTAWALLLIPALIGAAERAAHFPGDLREARLHWALASDYIQKISRSTSSTIFTVDDVTGGFASNQFIARFAGFDGRLIRVNDLAWLPGCRFQPEIEVKQISATEVAIASDVHSSCASHNFGGIWKKSFLDGGTVSTSIGPIKIVYRHPPGPPSGSPLLPDRLLVDIENAPSSSLILTPDFASRTYTEFLTGGR